MPRSPPAPCATPELALILPHRWVRQAPRSHNRLACTVLCCSIAASRAPFGLSPAGAAGPHSGTAAAAPLRADSDPRARQRVIGLTLSPTHAHSCTESASNHAQGACGPGLRPAGLRQQGACLHVQAEVRQRVVGRPDTGREATTGNASMTRCSSLGASPGWPERSTRSRRRLASVCAGAEAGAAGRRCRRSCRPPRAAPCTGGGWRLPPHPPLGVAPRLQEHPPDRWCRRSRR